MSDFKPGLEGVVAFETEIAEPDRAGGSLRYFAAGGKSATRRMETFSSSSWKCGRK